MKFIRKVLIMVLAAALLASAAYAGGTPKIVCTNFPAYDFARSEIELLIKPGLEVHSYEPTPADILKIAGCDLFIYTGGESDAWVKDILASFGSDAPATLRFFDFIECSEEAHDHSHEHGEGHVHAYDEHIWTSPTNAIAMVEALAAVLGEVDAENEAVYSENAAAYAGEIAQLRDEFCAAVENAAHREMVFADRFPFLYFVEEFGLAYTAAFPSCAAESEPSARTLAMLIEKVKEAQLPVVYVLEMSSGRTAKTVSEETGAQIRTFHSVQNVSEEEFTSGETYVSLMQKNLEALKEGIS